MKCQGKFKFKTIVRRDGGEFVNDKGQKLQYPESYRLQVDEVTDDGINERLFKLPIDSPLVKELQLKKPYEDITLEFDVAISSSRVVLMPVALIK